ncbi:hypothetical protein [Buchananella felis]|uniref:hypothetical protein n=1 Tax=Buchananella felis TaxID=3231492 RepID=UPI003528DDE1
MSRTLSFKLAAVAAASALALLGGCSTHDHDHDHEHGHEHGHSHEGHDHDGHDHEGHDDHEGHGQVEGAEQLKEPALSLVTLTGDGHVSLVDLAELKSQEIAHVDSPVALVGDGRYVAVQTGTEAHLVDSGVWSWKHGDHFHYYRAAAGMVAHLPGTGAAAASSEDFALVRAGDSALVLDKEALTPGKATEAGLEVPGVQFAALLEDTLVSVEGGKLVSRELGDHLPASLPAAQSPIDCADFKGGAAIRDALVVTCGNTVHTATVDHAAQELVFASHTLLDVEAGALPVSFCGRADQTQLAATSGDGSALWLIDAAGAEVGRVAIDAPVASACALGGDSHRVVAVDAAGAVRVFEGSSVMGLNQAAVTEAVASPQAAKLGIAVTENRAYVVGAKGDEVLEIDPADSARVARTIPAPGVVALATVGL